MPAKKKVDHKENRYIIKGMWPIHNLQKAPVMRYILAGEIGMRNKKAIVLALFAMTAVMTGTAMASNNCGNDDKLTAGFTGNVFHAEAWDTCAKWYEIRFYEPGVLPDFDPLNTPPYIEDILEEDPPNLVDYPYSTGILVGGNGEDYFWGSNCIESAKCVVTYSPQNPVTGDWIVVLMKAGTSGTPPQYMTSYRISTKVPVNIPEFPSIAIPIAAVIGLVFFFQHRKNN